MSREWIDPRLIEGADWWAPDDATRRGVLVEDGTITAEEAIRDIVATLSADGYDSTALAVLRRALESEAR